MLSQPGYPRSVQVSDKGVNLDSAPRPSSTATTVKSRSSISMDFPRDFPKTLAKMESVWPMAGSDAIKSCVLSNSGFPWEISQQTALKDDDVPSGGCLGSAIH